MKIEQNKLILQLHFKYFFTLLEINTLLKFNILGMICFFFFLQFRINGFVNYWHEKKYFLQYIKLIIHLKEKSTVGEYPE